MVHPENSGADGGMDVAGTGLMRRLVVPPNFVDGWMPQDLFTPEDDNLVELCSVYNNGNVWFNLVICSGMRLILFYEFLCPSLVPG